MRAEINPPPTQVVRHLRFIEITRDGSLLAVGLERDLGWCANLYLG